MAEDNKPNYDNVERLAKMEAQVENVSTVVTRLEGKIDAWATNFITRNEAQEMFRSRDREMQELKEKQNNKATLFAGWAGVIVSLLAVGVAIIAIISS